MNRIWYALVLGASFVTASQAHVASPVSIEIVGPDGRVFREIPANARDGALRSWLQAEKGENYSVRVRNNSGDRLGLVIAVDGRNIINGARSELERSEPMYVLDGWESETYSGWRANLEVVNEFYFTDWPDSYAEAFGDRSARGVIAVAVYREQPPPAVFQPRLEQQRNGAAESGAPAANAPPATSRADKAARDARRDESAGTGYGERRIDHAVAVEFTASEAAPSRHFIKYEWRETLCRKHVLDCDGQNRFWDDSTLGFAQPPPDRNR
jgi:hypothetical protein